MRLLWKSRIRDGGSALIIAILMSGFLSGPVSAVTPEQWRFRTAADFDPGEFQSVSIDENGAVRLSSRLEEIFVAPDPYLWSLVVDRKGTLYAGSGNDGKIFRVEPGQEGELFFDGEELEVHALALARNGRLYAGTSAPARVYRFDADGNAEMFFDPERDYIWDLAFLPDGDLLVATGPGGILYRVDPEGAAKVWFDSEDTHIRSILISRKGDTVIGTSGQGLIVKISPEGEPFVLYDSPKEEVVDLAEAPDGSLYAATLQKGKKPTPKPVRGGTEIRKTPASTVRRPSPPRNNVVYRIDPDGVPKEFWTAKKEKFYSLLWSEGTLLVGTGDPGRVVALTGEGEATERIRTSSAQVTALVSGPRGSIFLATSNLGGVSKLDSESAGQGEYLSTVKDTRTVSDWGNVSWKADTPQGSSVRLMVRTGNTAKPDRTWSEWSTPYTDSSGTRIDRPKARYIQWKAVLDSGEKRGTPALREVMVAYLQTNLAPRVESVKVLTPGTQYQRIPSSSSTSTESKPPTPVPVSSTSKATDKKKSKSASLSRPERGVRSSFQKGRRTARWTATDANGDSLTYSVYFRGEGEKLWKVLKEGIKEKFLSWDATAMPDGAYQIRVVASDTPSNPRGEALEGEKTSDSFFVDHTPPQIENLDASVRAGKAEVTFLVTDSFSPIETAHYSVDAQEWQALYPEDRVADSISESFRFETDDLISGEHTIVVRAADEMGNRGSGKIILEIP